MAQNVNVNPEVLIAAETPRVTTMVSTANSAISWGAILAGVVIAAIVYIAMNMLGLAIGAATINPESAEPVGSALGTATVIWVAATVLLSTFAGGWVAGHMSGRVDDTNGVLHGLVAWALVTLLILSMLSSAASSIINGVTSAVGQGISLIGANVADVVPEVADSLNLQETVLTSIREEAGTVRAPVAEDENGAVQAGTQNPTNTSLVVAVSNLLAQDADTPQAQETRQAAINLLQETGMSQQEATSTLERWENDYRGVATQAQERAEAAAGDVADAIAVASGVIFMMLVLGAFAAGAGGYVGASNMAWHVGVRE